MNDIKGAQTVQRPRTSSMVSLFIHDFLDASKINFCGDMDDQVYHILQHVRLTQYQLVAAETVLGNLRTVLWRVWPGVRIHPFGSIITGLGIQNSDLDCYIQLPDSHNIQRPIPPARKALNKYGSTFTRLFPVYSAKVPILKFVHQPTGLHCDINFSNPGGVRNSSIIRFMLKLDKNALPLAIILKYWSKVYNLTGKNLLSSYAFTLMVIFYLQTKSVLPSVAELQENTPCLWVKGWNMAFNADFTNSRNYFSLYELIGGFFEFYYSFDFSKYAISPYLGYQIEKNRLRDVKDLPSVYGIYQQNVAREICDVIQSRSLICIQDTFDHSRNCSLAISVKHLEKIRGHIAIVYKEYNRRSGDEFLKAMFTHRLVYEPNLEPRAYGLERIRYEPEPVSQVNVRHVPKRVSLESINEDLRRAGYVPGGFVNHGAMPRNEGEDFFLKCLGVIGFVVFWMYVNYLDAKKK